MLLLTLRGHKRPTTRVRRQNPAFIDRKENSYARVSEHNKKLLKENVELREDSKKLQKIRAAIGEDRAAEILRAGKTELIR